MITLGGSAFKPYYRPTTVSGDGLSPTDQMSPLSILTDLLGAGVMPAELQAALATAAASLQQQMPAAAEAAASGQAAAAATDAASAAGGKAKRKRTTFTASQAAYLEKEYDADQYMPRSRRIAVAESLQLSENQIKTWFQNRRAKDKKIRTLSTACPSSTVLLPSSSPMLSPAPSAASSSSSTPPLSAAPTQQPLQLQLQQPLSDPMPSLIELLALGKTDLLPLLNSQLLSSFNNVQASSPPQ